MVAIPLGILWADHFVHARGKPEAESQGSRLGSNPRAASAEADGSSFDDADEPSHFLGSQGSGESANDGETRGTRGTATSHDRADRRERGERAGPRERGRRNANTSNNADDDDSDTDKNAQTIRVLLVGNSYTMHHSLHSMLQRLAARVDGGPRMTVDAVAHGGYSLSNHLRTGQALARIRAGHYTHVVLQGHSMSAVDHPDKLIADAKRFKQAIDAAAGQTVFYATWARSPEVRMYRTHKSVRSFAQMSMLVSSTYYELSSLLGAALAPVGSAFERALIEHPRLPLWGADGSHPSLAGSYMAACVLYGAITGIDPSRSSYAPPGLKQADAALVRAVAARSLAATRTAQMNTELTTAGPFLGPT